MVASRPSVKSQAIVRAVIELSSKAIGHRIFLNSFVIALPLRAYQARCGTLSTMRSWTDSRRTARNKLAGCIELTHTVLSLEEASCQRKAGRHFPPRVRGGREAGFFLGAPLLAADGGAAVTDKSSSAGSATNSSWEVSVVSSMPSGTSHWCMNGSSIQVLPAREVL